MAKPEPPDPLPGQLPLFPGEVPPAPPSPRMGPEPPTVPDGLNPERVAAGRSGVLRALWAGGFMRAPALDLDGARCLPGLMADGLVTRSGDVLTLTPAGEAAARRLGP